jgi:hypothetical protein
MQKTSLSRFAILMPVLILFISASCSRVNTTPVARVAQGGGRPVDNQAEPPLAIEQQRDILLNEATRVQRILPELQEAPPKDSKAATKTDGCIKHHYSGFPKVYLRSDFTGCNWTLNPDDAVKSRRHELKGKMEFTDNTPAGASVTDANTRTANGDMEITVVRPRTKKTVTRTTWHHEVTLTAVSTDGWYPVTSKTSFGGLDKKGNGSWEATHSAHWQITPNPDVRAGAPLNFAMREGALLTLNYLKSIAKKQPEKIVYTVVARSQVLFIKDQYGCSRATGSFDWEQTDSKDSVTSGSFQATSTGIFDSTTHATQPWKNDCMR